VGDGGSGLAGDGRAHEALRNRRVHPERAIREQRPAVEQNMLNDRLGEANK